MPEDVEVNVNLAISKAQKDLAKLDKKFDKFERSVKKNVSGANSALKVFKGTLGALGVAKAFGAAARAAGAFFKVLVTDGVAAAQVQQEAVNAMEVSLSRLGETSAAASQEIQDFATNLQLTTGIGDETTLELFALSAAFTDNKEKAKQATQAAVELAVVGQLSLQEATRRVGRAFSGSVEDIAKFAPAIKNLTKDQLLAGDASRLLIEALGGSAAAKLRTFGGAVDATSGDFGDFTEKIGDLIIKNKGVVKAVSLAGKVFRQWGKDIADNSDNIRKFINEGIVKLIDAIGPALDVINFFASAFKVAWNVVTTVARIGVAAVISGFQALGMAVSGVMSALGQDTSGIDAFVVAAQESMDELTQEIKDDAVDIADALGGSEAIELFKEKATQAGAALSEGFRAGFEETPPPTSFLPDVDAEAAKSSEIQESMFDILFASKEAEKLQTKSAQEQQKIRAANFKSSLGVIAGLSSSSNRVLAGIGKAAAISTATIDGIVAVQKALSSAAPPFNFIIAGLVGAAAAVNVAKIAGVRGFQAGGLIGGSQTSGDNVPILANSRESVLTLDQQTDLFNFIAAGSQGGGGGGLTINNPVLLNDGMIDTLIDAINERTQFGNQTLNATGLNIG